MSKTQPIRSTTQLNQFKKYYQEIIPGKRNYALIILGLNTALRISVKSFLSGCGGRIPHQFSFLQKNLRTDSIG